MQLETEQMLMENANAERIIGTFNEFPAHGYERDNSYEKENSTPARLAVQRDLGKLPADPTKE